MRIEQDQYAQFKNYVYMGSSALLFLVGVLALAALVQTGGSDGRLGWVFGLVCCSLVTFDIGGTALLILI